MIKGIFVIHKSGICIYNKSISKISRDAQLVGGFLSAIYKFCDVSVGERIVYICTNTLKFNYIHENDLFFVFISDKNDIVDTLMPQIKYLMKEFYSEFVNQRIIFEKEGLIPDFTKFETCISNICS